MSDSQPPSQALLDGQSMRNLLDDVLRRARQCGATSAEASIGAGAGLSVTVRKGEVETIEHNRDKGLSVTVYDGKKKGSASSSDFSAEAIADTVKTAYQIAAYGGSDEFAGLADAELMATDIPDLDLNHPWDLTPDAAITIALEAEGAALDVDPRINNSDGATVASRQSESVYANSHGFVGGLRSTRHSLSVVVIAEQDGAMQRDYWYSSTRHADELEAALAVGQRAAQRTVRRLGGRQLSTTKVPVLYAAEIASSLVGHFIGAISGGSLYRKASFLLDHLDQQVFPDGLRIHEQPLLPRGMGSAGFDAEGVATTNRDLVTDGILRSYVLSSYSARRLGLNTTANAGGVRNVSLEGSSIPFDALLNQLGTGLYVTELIGMGVNTVTGDYSRGASGFWVENGVIEYPVEEITIAGNLKDMYASIVGLGDDVDARGNIRTGSILIEQMTVAGK
jgi:PmbA protein